MFADADSCPRTERSAARRSSTQTDPAAHSAVPLLSALHPPPMRDALCAAKVRALIAASYYRYEYEYS